MSLRWLVPCAVAGVVLVMGALYVHVPPNPDQAIFDYAGWVGAQGGRYYLDVAEQNFPGAMMLHELAQRIFGNHIWTFRAFDFLVLLAGAAALFDLLRRAGMTIGAGIVVPLYVVEYCASGQWMAGQRDLTGANLLLVAAAAFVRRATGGSRAWLACISVCTLVAVLLRPSYLVFGVVLIVIDVLGRRRTRRSLALIGSDALIATVVFAAAATAILARGAATGGLSHWYQQSIQFNLEIYSSRKAIWASLVGNSGLISRFSVLIATSAFGFYACLRLARGRSVATVLAGLLVTAVVSTLAQGKGYGYHLGAIIPALCGLSAVAIDVLWTKWRLSPASRGYVAGLTAASIAIVVSSAWHLRMLGPQIRFLSGVSSRTEMLKFASTGCAGCDWADVVEAVDYVRRTVPPDETVLVWSRVVSINVLAERRSPTRFITFGMLALARPPFSQAETWSQEFEGALTAGPPELVFADGTADAEQHALLWDAPEPGSANAILRDLLLRRYERETAFGSLEVWRLRRQ